MAQNLVGRCYNQKLCLTWDIIGDVKTLTVHVATSADFITRERMFVVPAVNGIELDTGMGAWFFRVGAWFPDGRVN